MCARLCEGASVCTAHLFTKASFQKRYCPVEIKLVKWCDRFSIFKSSPGPEVAETLSLVRSTVGLRVSRGRAGAAIRVSLTCSSLDAHHSMVTTDPKVPEENRVGIQRAGRVMLPSRTFVFEQAEQNPLLSSPAPHAERGRLKSAEQATLTLQASRAPGGPSFGRTPISRGSALVT